MGGSNYSKDWRNSYHNITFPSSTYIPTRKIKVPISKSRTTSSIDTQQKELLNSEIKKLKSDLLSVINRLDNILKIYDVHPDENSKESSDGR